ncbi:histidine phosphatase family protein [Acetonema longum]|uniref:Phosphoglycerate mutase n=1 Tax=Acetonema longum DSM 6540 TaxID=1009370 RepID=F7NJ57_9FIRM|nr:histidine phosphatase family protein [Acetonema longum]EGO63947.1 phosphoglycerate mutase [Acetonema longum DSM 6540]
MQAIVLIRHAAAEHHINGLTGGWTDSALTEQGCRQAALLAERLHQELNLRPISLYTSDLRRARETAAILGSVCGIEPLATPDLRELNNGLAAGKTEAQAQKLALARTKSFLDWQHYPGAETWRQLYIRSSRFMRELAAQADRGDTLPVLVAHSGSIKTIVAWWIDVDIASLEKLHVSFDISPASITVLRRNKWQESTIERLNDTAHLYAAGMAAPFKI